MADEDKTAAGPKPAETTESEAKSAAPPRAPSQRSEWTASDERRPLERAEDGDEDAGEPSSRKVRHEPEPESIGDPVQTPPHASTTAPVDPVAKGAATVDKGTGTTSATTAASPRHAEPSRGRSLWPVAAAVVLGAVIGAGTAYIDGRYLQGDSAQGPDVAGLAARVEALEKRPDAQAAVADIRSSVTALANRVAAQQKAPAASSPPPQAAPAPPPAADTSGIDRKIAALQADLASLKTQAQGANVKALQDKIASLEGALSGLKTATAAAQASATSVEGQQKTLAGRVMVPALAVVADSLVQQIAQGQPYGAQVDALVALGVDPAKIAPLRESAERGVPSAKTLAAKFEPIAAPTAATAQKLPPNAGFMDRLKTGALSMVSIRRADDTSGDDLPSRVARIKASLAHDDVPGAVATWDALPADAKAKSAGWGALAKTSADAMNAARALQRDAIIALGAKKS